MATNESLIPTKGNADVVTMVILIDGKEISGEFHILSILVNPELNKIPSAVIHIADGEASKATFEVSNTDLFIPGKKIEIQLGYSSENQSVFKASIIRHSMKIRTTSNLLMMECRDEAVQKTKIKRSRYFIDKKDNEIIEELIDFHKLKKNVAPTKPELKDIVQFDSSDWDFLVCRAESNGFVVAVEDGKINVIKPETEAETILKVQFGSSLLELDAEIDARHQSKVIKAGSWDAGEQSFAEVEATEPASFKNGNLKPEDLADVTQKETTQFKHAGILISTELQAWADSLLLKERLSKVRGRVKFIGFPDILPGNMIEIAGIGNRFEGKLFVSGVHHTVANGNWETNVQFGINPKTFSEQFNLCPLPSSGLLPGINGLQSGIVTALENDPDGEDRVKVRLPIINSKEEGIWARVATL